MSEALPNPSERLVRRTRLAWILVGAMFVLLLAMATVLRIGGAVIGTGEVTVESSVKTISHAAGGVLAEVLVRNGDRVKRGQPLLRLDTNVSAVGSAAAETGLLELFARRARLEAERDGAATIAFPSQLAGADSAALVARERRTFGLRRQQRDTTIALLGERVRQFEQQIEGYRAQIAAADGQLKLIEPELDGVRKLHARQLVTISRVNELERAAVQLRGSRGALTSSIAAARAQIAEVREQMLNVDKGIRSDAAAELAQIAPQLNDQRVRSASAQDALTRAVIRAPQDGVVDKLAYTAVGSAVPPGQPILQIVPDKDALLIEARLRPQDIDQVRAGQSARVIFSGLDRQTTPEVPGKVTFVAPDLAQDSHTGVSYYRVRIVLEAAALAHTPGLGLKAGMPAEVFVETSSRSILSFLLKPLFDQVNHAFRDG